MSDTKSKEQLMKEIADAHDEVVKLASPHADLMIMTSRALSAYILELSKRGIFPTYV